MKSLKRVITDLLRQSPEPGAEVTPCDRQQAIALAIIDKAMKGDLHAVTFIRDLTEKQTSETPSDRLVTVRVIENEKISEET